MKIDEFYNNVANEYEGMIRSPKVDARLMSKIKEIFLKHNINEGKILDVGCGPGNLQNTLGDRFTYTGIDISEKMLAKAKEKGYKIIHNKLEDAIVQIQDKSFDYIISSSVLHFVKDINLIIENFDRIARRGWLITLPDITENYIKNFPVNDPMYNHVEFPIAGTTEDVLIYGWTSPSSGEKIIERVVFKMLQYIQENFES